MVKDVSRTNMVQALEKEKMESTREEVSKLILEVGTIYHCLLEKDAIELFSKLHELGYTWKSGDSLLEHTHWDQFKFDTCYHIGEDKKIRRSFIDLYIDLRLAGKFDGDIIEYEAEELNIDEINESTLEKEYVIIIQKIEGEELC